MGVIKNIGRLGKNYAKRGRLALEEAKEGRYQGRALDLSNLDEMPNIREQFALERYDPPRGMPKSVGPVIEQDPGRLLEYALEGTQRGGAAWYNTAPLFDEFVSELGPLAGKERFDRFMDIIAATSPRSRVDSNIKRASYLYGREAQGLPISGLENKDFPKGYGHLAHKTQDYLLRDLDEGKHFEALERPKTSSFAENLKGNFAPMTIDTHNRAVVFDEAAKKSPSKTEYSFLEDFQAKLAEEVGLSPAQWQSAVWVGADDITGVANSRPFLEVFDNAVVRTAETQGKTTRQVLRDFISGKAPLASIMGAVGAGTLAPGEAEASTGLSDALEAGASVASSIAGGTVSDLSALGGYLRGAPVDEVEAAAEGLAGRLQYRPEGDNPYLNRLGEELEQFGEDISPLTKAWPHSIPGRLYQGLPRRARGIIESLL